MYEFELRICGVGIAVVKQGASQVLQVHRDLLESPGDTVVVDEKRERRRF